MYWDSSVLDEKIAELLVENILCNMHTTAFCCVQTVDGARATPFPAVYLITYLIQVVGLINSDSITLHTYIHTASTSALSSLDNKGPSGIAAIG